MTEEDDGPVAAARETARRGIAQARKTATDVITATKEKGEELIDDTREKTLRAAAETNRLFQEHPITAVAAAAAAGAVIGIFLPRIALASRASKLAGQAIKAVAASEVTQAALSGLSEAPKAAAIGVGKRLLSQRAKPTDSTAEPETPEENA